MEEYNLIKILNYKASTQISKILIKRSQTELSNLKPFKELTVEQVKSVLYGILGDLSDKKRNLAINFLENELKIPSSEIEIPEIVESEDLNLTSTIKRILMKPLNKIFNRIIAIEKRLVHLENKNNDISTIKETQLAILKMLQIEKNIEDSNK